MGSLNDDWLPEDPPRLGIGRVILGGTLVVIGFYLAIWMLWWVLL